MRIEIILREPATREDILAASAKASGVPLSEIKFFESNDDIDWNASGTIVVIDDRDPPGFVVIEISRKFDPSDPWPSDEEASRLASIGGVPTYAWDSESLEEDILIEFTDGRLTARIPFNTDD